jgi:hypothetical protein
MTHLRQRMRDDRVILSPKSRNQENAGAPKFAPLSTAVILSEVSAANAVEGTL